MEHLKMLISVVPQSPNPTQLKKHFQDFKKTACVFEMSNNLPQNNKTVKLSDGPYGELLLQTPPWPKIPKTRGQIQGAFAKT